MIAVGQGKEQQQHKSVHITEQLGTNYSGGITVSCTVCTHLLAVYCLRRTALNVPNDPVPILKPKRMRSTNGKKAMADSASNCFTAEMYPTTPPDLDTEVTDLFDNWKVTEREGSYSEPSFIGLVDSTM